MNSPFFTLRHGLPRQGPGSDASTRRMLELAGPLPVRPRVLDIGCGPGRSALLLADEASADVTAVDLHQPFLDELTAAATARGLTVRTVCASMADLPFPDASYDVLWAEGSAYSIGFDTALRTWRRLLAPGGVLVVTECEWATGTPSAPARAFWDQHYRLRSAADNVATAQAAWYDVVAVHPLPDSDWFDEYYTPLTARLEAADLGVPGMPEAVAAARAEIAMRQEHGGEYRYVGYILRPHTETDHTMTWTARPETATDHDQVREVNLAAFPTAQEADLVEALRADRDAWLPGLSWVVEDADGRIAAFALLTRCHVDGAPALALGPCAVRPEFQRQGAGSAVIRAALRAAREQGENLVLVLGHAEYYPRFGCVPASRYGIRAPFEVEDQYMMALVLAPSRPVPSGTIRYAEAFGV